MKKTIAVILSIMMAFFLVSCSSGNENVTENTYDRPPAFSILQKQLTLVKHSEKGETASFNKEDFKALVGEELTYVKVASLPEASLGTLIYKGTSVILGQTIPASTLEYLKFVPNGEIELATFGFSCDAQSLNGKEIKCEISFTDQKNLSPLVFDSTMKTVSGIGCESNLEINEPNGDSFTVNVITYPRDGRIKIEEGGRISYVPNPDFSGKDTLVYTVTDRFGATSERATLTITVEENESRLVFEDMQDSEDHLYAYRVCSQNVMVYRITDGKYYFDPEAAVSKIEFLVMMMNAAGLDTEIAAVADSAVSDDDALSSGLKGYLSAANEQNLIKLDNGAFAPFEKITVADAAYMISSALKLPEANSESVSTGSQDRTLSSILAANKAGFFESLSPSHTLTKQETANALCRMIDYINENNIPLS